MISELATELAERAFSMTRQIRLGRLRNLLGFHHAPAALARSSRRDAGGHLCPPPRPLAGHDGRDAAAGGREQPHLHRRLWPAGRADPRGADRGDHPHLQPRLSLWRARAREAERETRLRADTMAEFLILRRGLHVRPLQPRRAGPDPRQSGRDAGGLPRPRARAAASCPTRTTSSPCSTPTGSPTTSPTASACSCA